MPVPVGFYEATLLWKATTGPKTFTSAIGLLDIHIPIQSPDATTVADSVYNVFTSVGKPCASGSMIDDYQFLGVSVAKGTSTGDVVGQHLQTVTGTVVDTCPPCNCSLLITKNTALGGRKYRGRMFVPVAELNEGAVDQSGNILSAQLGPIQARWTAAFTALQAAFLEPILFHQDGGVTDPTPITSLTVQALIATQRRRMRR